MYNIEDVAAELLLEPVDLQEIYHDFFAEAELLLQDCKTKAALSDFGELKKIVHALKGMAANLRMEQLVHLLRQAEQEITNRNIPLISDLLDAIALSIEELSRQVSSFYLR